MNDGSEFELQTDEAKVLLNRHSGLIHAFCHRYALRVGFPSDAGDDVEQETYLSLLERLRKDDTFLEQLANGDEYDPFYKQMRKDAWRAAKRYERRMRRERPQSELGEGVLVTEGIAAPPEDEEWSAWESRRKAQILRQCLGRLAQRQRDAVVLRFYKKQKLSEIAMQWRTGETNVWNRLRDALANLKKCLRRHKVAE